MSKRALILLTLILFVTNLPFGQCPFDCTNATPISCGQTIFANNGGGTTCVDIYACLSIQNFALELFGPENIYQFTIFENTDVEIILDDLTDDLDIYLTDECNVFVPCNTCAEPYTNDPAMVVDYCNISGFTFPETISVENLAAGTYYIIVDGFPFGVDDGIGDYSLTLNCCAAAPTNCEITENSPLPLGFNQEFGDINNDGFLDLIQFEFIGNSTRIIAYLYDPAFGYSTNFFTIIAEGFIDFSLSPTYRLGDLNNDNLVDAVITRGGMIGESIRGAINLGNNEFQEVPISSTILSIAFNENTVVGDADNDGDQDVIACDGSTCYLFRNNGDLTFEEDFLDLCLDFNTALIPRFIADFDKDGNNDLLAERARGNEVIINDLVIYPNIDNTCENCTGQIILSGDRVQDIGDHDNDGDLDILATFTCPLDNFIFVHENQFPEFAFLEDPLENINACERPIFFAEWKDIDADEDLDLGITHWDCEVVTNVTIYRKDVDAYFSIFELSDHLTIVFGDYDMDGRMGFCGIRFLPSSESNVTYYSNLENCGLNTPPLAPPMTSTTIVSGHGDVILEWSPAIDPDFNPSEPDHSLSYNIYLEEIDVQVVIPPLANVETGKRKVVALGAQSLDTFWHVKDLPTGTYSWKVQAIDDGCAGGAWSTSGLFAIENCFDLNPTELNLGFTSFQFNDINLADFSTNNANQLLDLIFKTDLEGGIPEIFENQGDLSFLPFHLFDDSGEYVISDLNGDNLLDVLIYNSGTYYIYLNETVSFFLSQVFEGGYTEPVIGDIDNDGDRDIILGSFSSGNINLIENLGNGQFNTSPKVIYPDAAALGRRAIALFDADLDGDLDVLSSKSVLGFTAFPRLEIIFNAHGVLQNLVDIGEDYGLNAIGDVDNDGDKDIINGYTGNCVECFVEDNTQFFKNSSGNFKRFAIDVLPCNYTYRDLKLGDMDNDGDLDLISVQNENQFNRHLYIHRNGLEIYGQVQFEEIYEQRFIRYCAIGDIDGDSDLDVVYPPIVSECGCLEALVNNTCIPNTPPSAPKITSCTALGDSIVITWDGAKDAEQPDTTLTYNISIYESGNPDPLIVSPMAELESGFRKVVQFGEQCENLSWTIKRLDIDAEYCIKIQAIDHSYIGGAWSEEVCCDFCPGSSSTVFVDDGVTDLVLCRGEDNEIIEFEYSLTDPTAEAFYTFFITDTLGIIIAQTDSVYDFNQLGLGKYLVYGVSYFDELFYEPGAPISQIGSTICDTLSDNFISVRIDRAEIIFAPDLRICFGESIPLVLQTSGVTCSWTPVTGLDNPNSCFPVASPPTTTTYTVVVTTAYGCSITETVTVIVDPLPVITTEDVTICIGESIPLPVNTSGSVSCVWSPPFGLDDPTSCNPIATPTSTTTYTLTVTDVNGCVNSGSVTVTVVNNPVANAGEDTAICLGECITLNGTGGSTCAWYLNDDFANGTISTSCQFEVCPEVTTTYTLVVFGGNACSDTTSITIFVNDLPEIFVSDVTICAGESIPLPVDVVGEVTCQWTPSAGLNDPSLCFPTANPDVTTTYTLLVTDDNGCTNTANLTVTVIANPVANPGSDADICIGECVTLIGSGGTSCAWYAQDDFEMGLLTTECTFTDCPEVTTFYTLVVFGAGNCSDTARVNVLVNPLPEIIVSDATICRGESIPMPVDPIGELSCQWSPSTGLNNPGICDPIASPMATTTYSVTVTDENGCMNTAALTISVIENPLANAGSDVTICAGDPPVLLNGSGGSMCSWFDAQGLIISDSCSATVAPGESTFYVLEVTNNIGDITCTSRDTVMIQVIQLPTVQLINDTVICSGLTLPLVKTNTGEVCNWSPATGLDDAASCFPLLTAMVSETYNVSVSDAFGCTTSDSVTIGVVEQPVAQIQGVSGICLGDSTTLSGSGGAICSWFDSDLILISTECSVEVSPVETSSYIFATVNVSGSVICVDSDTIELSVFPLPSVTLQTDTLICTNGTAPLVLNQSCEGCMCFWTPETELNNPESCDAILVPQTPGDKSFELTAIDLNGCQTTGTAFVSVVPVPSADVLNDHFTIRRGQTETFEILENDNANGEWAVTLLNAPEGVSVSLDESNQLIVSAGGSFLGLTSFDYEISDPLCGVPSQTGIIEIQVIETDKVCICDPDLEPGGCELLPNIDDFPDNRIVIFNRYGNIVHLDSPFENDWNGVNIETGDRVPTGAYYFALELGTDVNGVDAGTIKGVIFIVRKGK